MIVKDFSKTIVLAETVGFEQPLYKGTMNQLFRNAYKNAYTVKLLR